MSDSPLPRSPFAGTIDFSDDTPVHPIDPDELARALQAHELYVETGQRSGQRANLDATDLAGKSFAGMKLWRIRMQRGGFGRGGLHGRRSAPRDPDRGDHARRPHRRRRSHARASQRNQSDRRRWRRRVPGRSRRRVCHFGQFGLPPCGFSRRRYERCHSRRRKPEWREPAAREPAWRLFPEYPYIRCGPPGCSNWAGQS